MLRADLADAEAERTRALRLVVGVLGRLTASNARSANGGIGSLLRDGDTGPRPAGGLKHGPALPTRRAAVEAGLRFNTSNRW